VSANHQHVSAQDHSKDLHLRSTSIIMYYHKQSTLSLHCP